MLGKLKYFRGCICVLLHIFWLYLLICAIADLLRTYANIDQLPEIARQSIYIILNHLAQCNVWSQSLETFLHASFFLGSLVFMGTFTRLLGWFFQTFGSSVCDSDWDSGWQTAIGLNSLDDQGRHIPRLCNTCQWSFKLDSLGDNLNWIHWTII